MTFTEAFFRTEIGSGIVTSVGESWHLTVPPAVKTRYHDAQISSYRRRREFTFRPPVKLTIRAYAEGSVQGTAGFGFWNHPYVPGEAGFRLPKAVWFFFGSPPNNMALAKDVPGHGWKAATFDATRWQFLMLLPTAPLGFLLMRVPALYRRLWPTGQQALGVSEKSLDASLLRQRHDYEIDWQPRHVTFSVDQQMVHRADLAIRGPLGFIAWVDNQYAVVTPQGRFGFGLLDVPVAQTLVIENLSISPAIMG
ncbi:MAG: family 16 glycosylhydrolase [bacterium]|nr:family 16 glycosylhydrolase [bacterium]